MTARVEEFHTMLQRVRARPAHSKPACEPLVRPRVIARLQAALQYPIALLVAPAGFGKTTALKAALEPIAHLYYPVRPENAGLLGFVRGLSTVAGVIAPVAVPTLAGAHAVARNAEHPPLELAAWFYAHIRDFKGTIAVDDFHVAARERAVCEFLSSLINRTRGAVRWIVATRDVGDLPIASWLSYGHAGFPVDDEDLRFRENEAAALADVVHAGWNDADIGTVCRLTFGWPTALRFAIDLSAQVDSLLALAKGTREMMYCFLAEQVFFKVSPRERSFLLETCVYPSIDVTLLSAAGYDDCASLVDGLRRTTSFVYAESEQVFRYHDLFREFLEHELRSQGPQGHAQALERAGSVLESGGAFGHALRAYADAAALDRVEHLLAECGFDLIDQGKGDLVEAALHLLDTHVVSSNAVLLGLCGRIQCTQGRFEEGEASFEQALALDSELSVAARIAYLAACSIANRDPARALRLLDAFACNRALPPEMDMLICSFLASIRAMAPVQMSIAQELMRHALGLMSAVQSASARATVLMRAGRVAYYRGEFEAAKVLSLEAAGLAETCGNLEAATVAYATAGAVGFATDPALEDCARYYSRAEDAAARTGNGEFRVMALGSQAAIHAERGSRAALDAIEARLNGVAEASMRTLSGEFARATALRAAWSADFAAAYRLTSDAVIRSAGDHERVITFAWLALYAAALGDCAQAQTAIDRMQAEMPAVPLIPGSSKRMFHALLLSALAALLLGETTTAHRTLEHLESARAHLSERMRALLSAGRVLFVQAHTGSSGSEVATALARLHEQDYGGYALLFAKLPLPKKQIVAGAAALTQAELAVLRAMGCGGTSREIAAKSNRAQRTIDWHVDSLRRKLGARSRREAVAIAREVGLIP